MRTPEVKQYNNAVLNQTMSSRSSRTQNWEWISEEEKGGGDNNQDFSLGCNIIIYNIFTLNHKFFRGHQPCGFPANNNSTLDNTFFFDLKTKKLFKGDFYFGCIGVVTRIVA